AAVAMTISRARAILQRSSALNSATLSVLENFARSTTQLPGRKLAFFISDGFSLSHTQATDAYARMRRITESSARSGLVIYTLDARGLMASTSGAENAGIRDETNMQARAAIGDIAGSQESLRVLAEETGGRALINTNALGNALTKAMDETSSYYLLAWRPEPNSLQANRAHRIEVSVKSRPDLTVRMRKNFYNQEARTPSASRQNSGERNARAATPESELAVVLRSFYPRRSLPTSVSVGFLDLPNSGISLTTTAQIDTAVLNLDSLSEGQKAVIDVAVAVFDGQDRYVSGYKQQFTIQPRSSNSTAPRRALLNRQFPVQPGLYQVRVAAREEQSGRTGSAVEWVEVPNLSQGKLALSALFIGEPASSSTENSDDEIEATRITPDHRFSRASSLRFVTYIYNAAHAPNAQPDIALQVQIFRGDQPVLTAPLRKVALASETDLARIPYAAEISLSSIPAGRYILQVTIIDKIARASATQRINFVVE
ncbi:MAG TPA: VWA domain-containing protein, partial [Pyrinomonadaceae bacterium]|nr:VWA domain-containing protein [Pyrinomonadaceae bacterium]